MQLVSVLTCGVSGAANGTARIYNRATSTRSTYYSDFYGTVHSTSGADLVLDSNGGAVAYVNQQVDVQVFDTQGNLLRSFTEGESAPVTEVISQSFTGVDYSTGASGASKPTTLQALADLWYTTNGAIDWKVLFNGSATSIKTAVAGVAGLFFNVKDPTYGAVGDGSTDDTTAIQNCINAAAAVLGIVIFPAGRYRVTSTLSCSGASLWGVGNGNGTSGSLILMDHATNNLLSYNPSLSTSATMELRNLTLDGLQANSGNVINMGTTQSVTLVVNNCAIGGSFYTGNLVSIGNIGHFVSFDSCFFGVSSSTNGAIVENVNVGFLKVRHCRFSTPSTYNGSLIIARIGTFQGNTFSMNGTNSGTYTCLNANGSGSGTGPKVTVIGNDFIPGSGTSTAISITNGNETDTAVSEAGNIFRATWSTVYSGFTASSNIPAIQAITRESLSYNVSDNSASVGVKAEQVGYTVLTRTNTANQTLTTAVGHGGATWTLIFFNNGGGASGTITFGSGFDANTPTISAVANGRIAVYNFRAVYVNGAAAWIPTAAVISAL